MVIKKRSFWNSYAVHFLMRKKFFLEMNWKGSGNSSGNCYCCDPIACKEIFSRWKQTKFAYSDRGWLCECACAVKENAPRHFNFGRQFSLIFIRSSSWNIHLPDRFKKILALYVPRLSFIPAQTKCFYYIEWLEENPDFARAIIQ